MKRLVSYLLLVLSLAACKSENASIPVYGWEGVNDDMPDSTLRSMFHQWKENGLTGVCIGAGSNLELIRRASALSHKEGLEYHAWIQCLPREGMPHSWYAVNRLGQSADEFPAFVPHYKFLDPHNPEVRAFLVKEMEAVAEIPSVDYVQLDYIRYPDVILARGLWEKYGLDMTNEYAPADYCYCQSCVEDFKAKTGIDILSVEDPSACPEWAQFRCDAVTGLVEEIVEAVHAKGKKVSADVFPGPGSHARWMVRQEWNKWPVDMLFPMNYNDFYLKEASWLEEITLEEVASVNAVPVISGLFICPDWENKAGVVDPENSGLLPSEMGLAVDASLRSGAAGVSLFTPSRMSREHWDALKTAIKR